VDSGLRNAFKETSFEECKVMFTSDSLPAMPKHQAKPGNGRDLYSLLILVALAQDVPDSQGSNFTDRPPRFAEVKNFKGIFLDYIRLHTRIDWATRVVLAAK